MRATRTKMNCNPPDPIPSFDSIWESVTDSVMGCEKSLNIYKEMLSTVDLPGVMAEIGVYRGGTARLMRLVDPNKPLHLYDTFGGIVEAEPSKDVMKNGAFSDTSLDSVKALVGGSPVYRIGKFPDTFLAAQDNLLSFSFVHSDTDTYFGTMSTLVNIAPLMVPGGKIMFDDFNWPDCPGVSMAIWEWIGITRGKYPDKQIRGKMFKHQIVFGF
jgi:O-methyltransferase